MREEAGELEEEDVPELERLAEAEKTNKTVLQKTNQGKADGGIILGSINKAAVAAKIFAASSSSQRPSSSQHQHSPSTQQAAPPPWSKAVTAHVSAIRWFFVCCECEACDKRAVQIKPMSASWKHARCPHSVSTPQMIHDPAHGGCGKRMLKCKCPGSPVPLSL